MKKILIVSAMFLCMAAGAAAEGIYVVEFARLGGAGVSTLTDENIDVAFLDKRFVNPGTQASASYETEPVLSIRDYLLPVDLAEFTLD